MILSKQPTCEGRAPCPILSRRSASHLATRQSDLCKAGRMPHCRTDGLAEGQDILCRISSCGNCVHAPPKRNRRVCVDNKVTDEGPCSRSRRDWGGQLAASCGGFGQADIRVFRGVRPYLPRCVGREAGGRRAQARRPCLIRSPCRPCHPFRPCRRRPASAAAASLGRSATIASVVISRPATEAASCSAQRTTLVGSITPSLTRSPYSPVWAL